LEKRDIYYRSPAKVMRPESRVARAFGRAKRNEETAAALPLTGKRLVRVEHTEYKDGASKGVGAKIWSECRTKSKRGKNEAACP